MSDNTYTLGPSGKRVVRTIYQLLVAVATGIPLVVLVLPADVQDAVIVALFATWAAVVTKAVNSLEDAGILPAWLKDD